jgi:hypothetical protein
MSRDVFLRGRPFEGSPGGVNEMSATTKAYLDGFCTAHSVIELDHLTLFEIVASLDPNEQADPSLTSWKRGYQAGIRAAFGW